MKYENNIDKSFRRGERPPVTTVGELVAELSELPNDLPMYNDFDDDLKVSVTNLNGIELRCVIGDD